MDYVNLLIAVVGVVMFAAVWRLPEIIRALRGQCK